MMTAEDILARLSFYERLLLEKCADDVQLDVVREVFAAAIKALAPPPKEPLDVAGLVERTCEKIEGDDVDPSWCRTHNQSWRFCKHRPLLDRLREDGNTNSAEAAIALTQLQQEKDRLQNLVRCLQEEGAAINKANDHQFKIIRKANATIASLRSALEKIRDETNADPWQRSIGMAKIACDALKPQGEVHG